MTPAVHRASDAVECERAERCWILEVANDADDPACSIARARVAPGVTTEWHWLAGLAERYLIVSGLGRVEVGKLPPADVGPGDVVCIPPDVMQRITNVGDVDLIFTASVRRDSIQQRIEPAFRQRTPERRGGPFRLRLR